MKTEDDCLLMAFCRGKVITQVKFPALDKFHGLGFACDLVQVPGKRCPLRCQG